MYVTQYISQSDEVSTKSFFVLKEQRFLCSSLNSFDLNLKMKSDLFKAMPNTCIKESCYQKT